MTRHYTSPHWEGTDRGGEEQRQGQPGVDSAGSGTLYLLDSITKMIMPSALLVILEQLDVCE